MSNAVTGILKNRFVVCNGADQPGQRGSRKFWQRGSNFGGFFLCVFLWGEGGSKYSRWTGHHRPTSETPFKCIFVIFQGGGGVRTPVKDLRVRPHEFPISNKKVNLVKWKESIPVIRNVKALRRRRTYLFQTNKKYCQAQRTAVLRPKQNTMTHSGPCLARAHSEDID